jgi:hypothetical protein
MLLGDAQAAAESEAASADRRTASETERDLVTRPSGSPTHSGAGGSGGPDAR